MAPAAATRLSRVSSPQLSRQLIRAVEHASAVRRLLVASDFDGTMSALVDIPDDARAVPETEAAMTALAGLDDTCVAVISGRSLAALHRLTSLPDSVHLVGSHGMEFDSTFAAGLTETECARLDQLNQAAAEIAATYPGATIEHKPASTALHYRHVDAAQRDSAIQAIQDGPAAIDGVHVIDGKEVVEIAVVQTNKGFALDRLRHQENADAVVFIGDDVTDEFAFQVLGEHDYGVKVGPGETSATLRVDDVDAVATLLTALADARRRVTTQA